MHYCNHQGETETRFNRQWFEPFNRMMIYIKPSGNGITTVVRGFVSATAYPIFLWEL